MVVTTVATFFGGWALDVVKKKAGETLDHRLNHSAVEGALKQAVGKAEKEVPELFSTYEKDGLRGIDRFLNNAFKETAIAELQKPLQDLGKPDDALLSKVFLREAESHSALGNIDPRLVEAWMQAFTEAYFQTTNNFLSYQVTKEKYYRQLRAKIGKVVFSGMAVDGTVVDKPGDLARIFVMPDVRRQSLKRYELTEVPLPDIASDGQKLTQWEQRQQLKLIRGESASQPSMLAVELLQSKTERRVVLLGAPGSGKTTLINYLVVAATSFYAAKQTLEKGIVTGRSAFGIDAYFPLLIRIRDLAREPDLSVLEFLKKFAETDLGVDSIPTGFFQHWLDRGQAIVLLDGLDEVADSAQRSKVVGKIETFLSACDRCPAIITSRPAGYRDDYFSRDQYPHYELLPFDDDKIEAFIDHWYDSRVDWETERERRKNSLRKALASKPRIKKLARNPLLLTIIALIHRYKANLPRQRHELYDSAVETLISTWDAEKELTIQPILKYLDIRDIRRLMKQLAYWVHTQGSVDDDENGTQIERNTLIQQLGKFIKLIKASENLQLYQVEEEAKAFLDQIIRDRAGLLSQQGENRYAFVHKTFQEYLCSQEILYLQKDPDDDDYVPYVKNHIQAHLHDPHWREVLLLLVAQQTPSPAKASLKTILSANSEYEQWLHRDLLFAGSCLAENAEIADRATIDQTLTELVNLETCWPPLGNKLGREVFRVISSLQDTPFASLAMEFLEQHQHDMAGWQFIDYQRELEPNKAIQWLLSLLKNEELRVRYLAISFLGRLANASEDVISELQIFLEDDDSEVRFLAARSLAHFGNTSQAVISELLLSLEKDDPEVRRYATESLGELSNVSEAVARVMLFLIKDDDSEVRHYAAESLGKLSNASETVVSALLLSLEDSDSEIRFLAAECLTRLGNTSEALVSTLLLLLKEQDEEARYHAAASLGRLGNTSEAVISALFLLLKDDDSSVRSSATESLAELGNASKTVVSALLLLLKDDNALVRFSAAKSLAELGNTSEVVIFELLHLLEEDCSWISFDVANSLACIGKRSNTVKLILVRWIEQHQNEEFVGEGIDVLWELVN